MAIRGIGTALSLFFETIHNSGRHDSDLARVVDKLIEISECLLGDDGGPLGIPLFGTKKISEKIIKHT